MSTRKRKHGKSSSHRPVKQRRRQEPDDEAALCTKALELYDKFVCECKNNPSSKQKAKRELPKFIYTLVSALQLSCNTLRAKKERNDEKRKQEIRSLLEKISDYFDVDRIDIDDEVVDKFIKQVRDHFTTEKNDRYLLRVADVAEMATTMMKAKPEMRKLKWDLRRYGTIARGRIWTIAMPAKQPMIQKVTDLMTSIKGKETRARRLRGKLRKKKNKRYDSASELQLLYCIEVTTLIDMFALKLLLKDLPVKALQDSDVDPFIKDIIVLLAKQVMPDMSADEAQICLKFICETAKKIGKMVEPKMDGDEAQTEKDISRSFEVGIVCELNRAIASVLKRRKSKSD